MTSESKSVRLLTSKEAASLLRVSEAFLARDRWLGPTIPFVKVGEHRVRYRRSDLEAYINRRQTPKITLTARRKRRRQKP